MDIECPVCKKTGVIDDSKIPAQGVNVTCPHCNNKFTVNKIEPPKDFEIEPIATVKQSTEKTDKPKTSQIKNSKGEQVIVPFQKEIGSSISKLWRGDYSLLISFWVFNILLVNLFKIITKIIAEYVKASGVELHINYGLPILVFFLITFDIICIVGVWRSSERYSGPIIWRALAKLCILVNIIAYFGVFGNLVSNINKANQTTTATSAPSHIVSAAPNLTPAPMPTPSPATQPAQSANDANNIQKPYTLLVEMSGAALSDLKNAATEVYANNVPDNFIGFKTSKDVAIFNYTKRPYLMNGQQNMGFELLSFHKSTAVNYKCICEQSCSYYIMLPGNSDWKLIQ